MGLFANRVELIGNLGRDPDIRHTQTGKKIATLNVATSESWKDQPSGEWRDRTEWHRVVVFNESLANVAERHLEKGMKIRIEGKLRTRKWQDPNGQDRYSTEVHVEAFDGSINFDTKRTEEPSPGAHTRQTDRVSGGDTPKGPDPDDDIPY